MGHANTLVINIPLIIDQDPRVLAFDGQIQVLPPQVVHRIIDIVCLSFLLVPLGDSR